MSKRLPKPYTYTHSGSTLSKANGSPKLRKKKSSISHSKTPTDTISMKSGPTNSDTSTFFNEMENVSKLLKPPTVEKETERSKERESGSRHKRRETSISNGNSRAHKGNAIKVAEVLQSKESGVFSDMSRERIIINNINEVKPAWLYETNASREMANQSGTQLERQINGMGSPANSTVFINNTKNSSVGGSESTIPKNESMDIKEKFYQDIIVGLRVKMDAIQGENDKIQKELNKTIHNSNAVSAASFSFDVSDCPQKRLSNTMQSEEELRSIVKNFQEEKVKLMNQIQSLNYDVSKVNILLKESELRVKQLEACASEKDAAASRYSQEVFQLQSRLQVLERQYQEDIKSMEKEKSLMKSKYEEGMSDLQKEKLILSQNLRQMELELEEVVARAQGSKMDQTDSKTSERQCVQTSKLEDDILELENENQELRDQLESLMEEMEKIKLAKVNEGASTEMLQNRIKFLEGENQELKGIINDQGDRLCKYEDLIQEGEKKIKEFEQNLQKISEKNQQILSQSQNRLMSSARLEESIKQRPAQVSCEEQERKIILLIKEIERIDNINQEFQRIIQLKSEHWDTLEKGYKDKIGSLQHELEQQRKDSVMKRYNEEAFRKKTISELELRGKVDSLLLDNSILSQNLAQAKEIIRGGMVDIEGYKAKIEQQADHLEQAQEHIRNLEEVARSVEKEIDDKNKELDEVYEQRDQLKEQVEELLKQFAEKTDIAKQISAALKEKADEIERMKKAEQSLAEQLKARTDEKAGLEEELRKRIFTIKSLEEKIEKMTSCDELQLKTLQAEKLKAEETHKLALRGKEEQVDALKGEIQRLRFKLIEMEESVNYLTKRNKELIEESEKHKQTELLSSIDKDLSRRPGSGQDSHMKALKFISDDTLMNKYLVDDKFSPKIELTVAPPVRTENTPSLEISSNITKPFALPPAKAVTNPKFPDMAFCKTQSPLKSERREELLERKPEDKLEDTIVNDIISRYTSPAYKERLQAANETAKFGAEKPYPVHRLISTYNGKPKELCSSNPTPVSLRSTSSNLNPAPAAINNESASSVNESALNDYGFYQCLQTPKSIRGLLAATNGEVADSRAKIDGKSESDLDTRLKNLLLENEKLTKRINVEQGTFKL